ncbi:uncharacterized protein BP5553_04506 [Venustampulla echinocandica]|uniref:Uncharacterized protein n=1 Tax=Venustampulla echinocandica TaxID=2656787 RepID=A0A370TNH3_9HELO|nr:uncharacterized protein BP5553_04506 [Venustampulla echinocandica]RDL37073.1 hypothetical protein BP5553_04506 [Venustampulla echinocandica]
MDHILSRVVLFAFDRHHYEDQDYHGHKDKFMELRSQLESKALVVQVLCNADAADFMSSEFQLEGVKAIILTDPRMTKYPAIAPIIVKLVAWVRAGGTLIMSSLFSTMVEPINFEKFIRNAWGLPWKYVDYSEHLCIPNLGHPERYWEGPYAIKPYKMMAAFLEDVDMEDRVFVREDDETDDKAAAVILKPFGEGRLGWIGDVNNEVGSMQVLLAMCRL